VTLTGAGRCPGNAGAAGRRPGANRRLLANRFLKSVGYSPTLLSNRTDATATPFTPIALYKQMLAS
jgi:hypothetical protein